MEQIPNQTQTLFIMIQELFSLCKSTNNLLLQIEESQRINTDNVTKQIEKLESTTKMLQEQNNMLINMLTLKNQSQIVKDMLKNIDTNMSCLFSQIDNTQKNINTLTLNNNQQQQSDCLRDNLINF